MGSLTLEQERQIEHLRGKDLGYRVIANELGLTNYETMDKGNLTARQNGYVGGYMVKKMIQYAEQNMPSASSASGMTMGMSK